MTPDQRKMIMRAIRKECILAISLCAEARIRQINESEISITHFISTIWENTERRLRAEGQSELLTPSGIREFDPHHKVRTVLGNMAMCCKDLKEDVPQNCDMSKIELWDKQWDEQKVRMKRVKSQDQSTLPKRVRTLQDTQAVVGGRSDASGTGTLMRTALNARCVHVVGIPHEGLVEGAKIGTGSFGVCNLYTIKGISFFEEHVTYVGKVYKGGPEAKFDSFQTEQGMQILHPSIVRCIGFTMESPWISIFPYYNGGSLGDLMCRVPYTEGAFRRCMHRLQYGWRRLPPVDTRLSEIDHARIKAVIEQMPAILHAVVDGIAAAHAAGVMHCDLHPFNVMLDFTRDNKPRIGIIDWGMMLRSPVRRASHNFTAEIAQSSTALFEAKEAGRQELLKRPWIAPELYDPQCRDAYTKASDIYALGFLFEMLIDYWGAARKMYFSDEIFNHPDSDTLRAIGHKVATWMKLDEREARRNASDILLFFKDHLKTDPNSVQRPLIELMPSFYPA